jgi:hypothetical protein
MLINAITVPEPAGRPLRRNLRFVKLEGRGYTTPVDPVLFNINKE